MSGNWVRTRIATCSAFVAVAACGAPLRGAPQRSCEPSATVRAPADRHVSSSELCVTAGRIGRSTPHHTFFVDAGGMRAVAAGGSGESAEMAFTYDGPSSSVARLANGELRRQVGLKLRARDTCNVVYVMWRIEPSRGIFVSVKRNPGMSTHEECGARGYVNVKPAVARRPPPVQRGEPHVLRADLDGALLRVIADGTPAWEGMLPPEAFDFDGPAGVRSDNVAFAFDLRVPPSDGATWACPGF